MTEGGLAGNLPGGHAINLDIVVRLESGIVEVETATVLKEQIHSVLKRAMPRVFQHWRDGIRLSPASYGGSATRQLVESDIVNLPGVTSREEVASALESGLKGQYHVKRVVEQNGDIILKLLRRTSECISKTKRHVLKGTLTRDVTASRLVLAGHIHQIM